MVIINLNLFCCYQKFDSIFSKIRVFWIKSNVTAKWNSMYNRIQSPCSKNYITPTSLIKSSTSYFSKITLRLTALFQTCKESRFLFLVKKFRMYTHKFSTMKNKLRQKPTEPNTHDDQIKKNSTKSNCFNRLFTIRLNSQIHTIIFHTIRSLTKQLFLPKHLFYELSVLTCARNCQVARD